MKERILTNVMFIHAGPTLGKTSLVHSYVGKFVDYDEVVGYAAPDVWEFRLHRTKHIKEVNEILDKALIPILNRLMKRGIIVIANRYSSNFTRGLHPDFLAEGKLPVSFFRTDLEEAVSLSKSRDGAKGFPPDMYQMWIQGWRRSAPGVFRNFFEVGKEKLSDIVTIKLGGEVIHQAGAQLSVVTGSSGKGNDVPGDAKKSFRAWLADVLAEEGLEAKSLNPSFAQFTSKTR